MWCFAHFDLEMCFAPQRRAVFRHLDVKKWSEPFVFWHFWLGNFAQQRHALFPHLNVKKWSKPVSFLHFSVGNVLRATTASTFSTSQLPKVVRTCNCVHLFDMSTSKSGPNMLCFVHFDLEMCFAPRRRAIFISHLARWLCTRPFSEPACRPSGATNHWKKYSESRLSYLFAHLHLLSSHAVSSLIFSLLGFSSLTLFPPLLLHLSILSEVWLPNFLRLWDTTEHQSGLTFSIWMMWFGW